MPLFDGLHQFQFALFMQQAPTPFMIPNALGEVMSQPASTGERLRLRFGAPQAEQVFTLTGPMPLVSWVAAGGLWRMTCSRERLDLFFDALGYADLFDETPSVLDVTARVRDALSAAATMLMTQRSIVRSAIIFSGQGFEASAGRERIQARAKNFLRESLREEQSLSEAMVRFNLTDSWPLADNDAWQVNRIETIAFEEAIKNVPETTIEKVYTWSLDVNTAPSSQRPMDGEALKAFFNRGAEWIAERVATDGGPT